MLEWFSSSDLTEEFSSRREARRRRIFPDRYDCSCAFHVTFGETYEEAAKRELREETGISGRLEYLGKFSHQDPPENQIVAVFNCKSNAPVGLTGVKRLMPRLIQNPKWTESLNLVEQRLG